jgi:hypothetical protein
MNFQFFASRNWRLIIVYSTTDWWFDYRQKNKEDLLHSELVPPILKYRIYLDEYASPISSSM